MSAFIDYSFKEHVSMSEASTATLLDASPANLPLSIMLFHAAMVRDIAISDFAEQLDIGALSLRQFISGQTQRPRGRTLELIANALDISVEEARHRTTLRPTSAPHFADWLKEQMKGRFSRAKLTRETRISDGALRNYLSGQTLPDADQAQRLALALGIESLDLAKVLVADQTVRAGGETIPSIVETVAVPADTPTTATDLPLSIAPSETNGEEDSAINRHVQRVNHSVTADLSMDEEHLLTLWRQLHPQGRRATLIYIAGLLAEG